MVYSCTSNGALRLTTLGQDDTPISHNLGSLPTRLCDWRNSPNNQTFAYGGDEVELSVWDTEKAFIPAREQGEGIEKKKKRKRGDDLFPGEIWRAKNVSFSLFMSLPYCIDATVCRCLMIILVFVNPFT